MYPSPYSSQYFESLDRMSLLLMIKSVVGHEEGVDLLLMIDRICPVARTPMSRNRYFCSLAADISTSKVLSIINSPTKDSSDISKSERYVLMMRVSDSQDFLTFIQLLSEKVVTKFIFSITQFKHFKIVFNTVFPL
jgi:hypothetical protein